MRTTPRPPRSCRRRRSGAEVLDSVSARKLSDGTLVGRTRSRIVGEGTAASVLRLGRRRAGAARALDPDAVGAQRRDELRRGRAGGPAVLEKPRPTVSAPSTPPMSRS